MDIQWMKLNTLNIINQRLIPPLVESPKNNK